RMCVASRESICASRQPLHTRSYKRTPLRFRPLALREDGELLALAGERDALTLRRLPGRRYHEERQLLWLSEKMAGVQLRTSPRVLNRYPDEAFLSAQLVRHAIKARTSVSKLGL